MVCLIEEAGLYGSTASGSPATSLRALLPPELPSLQAGPLVGPLTLHQLHSPFGQEDLLRNVLQLRDRCSRTRKPMIPTGCWQCLWLSACHALAANCCLWDGWFCWEKPYWVYKYMLCTSVTRPADNTASIILPLHLPNIVCHCTRNFKRSSLEV